MRDKLSDVFVQNFDDENTDPEQALYSGGFFSESDKAQMAILHSLPPEKLGTHPFQFEDKRLDVMLFRYRARNYPLTLTNAEQHKWQQYCQQKIQYGGNGALSAEEYMMKIENLAHEYEQNSAKMSVLKALYEYIQG